MELIRKTFDQLSIDELYGILRLRSEVFVVEQDCVYQDLDGKDKMSWHYFAMDNGEPAAYLRILPKGLRFPEASIGRVVLKKEYRRTGLSSKIMQAALDFAKHGLKEDTLRISAQAHLQKFYGKFGFQTVSGEYLEDGIPHVEMLLTAQHT